jgi:hypothetical protein
MPDYHGSIADTSTRNQITNLNLHQIAAAQLALDREVEKGTISELVILVEHETHRQISLSLNGRFAPSLRPAFQPGPLSAGSKFECPIVLHGQEWP